jgi:hypothetical protein
MHKGRVMAVAVKDDILVTVGSDNRLKLVTISTQKSLVDEQPTGLPLNDMILKDNRLFVASSGGKMVIYDFN